MFLLKEVFQVKCNCKVNIIVPFMSPSMKSRTESFQVEQFQNRTKSNCKTRSCCNFCRVLLFGWLSSYDVVPPPALFGFRLVHKLFSNLQFSKIIPNWGWQDKTSIMAKIVIRRVKCVTLKFSPHIDISCAPPLIIY